MYQKKICLKWQHKENNVLKIRIINILLQGCQKNDTSVWEAQGAPGGSSMERSGEIKDQE